MAKRRWIQDPKTHELIEVSADYRSAPLHPDSGALWGDSHYDNLRAPDGTDISSRAKHKAYMRATGLTTTDDFKGSWAKAQEQRDYYRQNGGSVKRDDIQRAIARLTQR